MTTIDPIYGLSWYAATAVAAPQRHRLSHDLDVDVCVIGGGFAGLTTARELARRGWSVALLEAKRIAWNASGRNGGFVGPGFAEQPHRIVERVGREHAKALWQLSADGVDYVRDTIRETAMPGVVPVAGWLYVRRSDDADRASAFVALINEFGTQAELWPTERVRAHLHSHVYFQGIHVPRGFHIHPLNYAFGLAADAESRGAQIFENTPALAIDPAGVRKRIDTPDARVRAGHIVLAGNVHLAPLCPQVAESVLPVTSHVAVTVPLGERLDATIAYAGAIIDDRRTGDYYRIVEGGRLLWGSGISARRTPPRRLAKVLRRAIRKTYPQLGDAEISHAWSGTMGYALHKMPQVGEVAPGLWVASAFGGHGLNTTAMAGDLIARAIVDGDDRWRLFSPYDLVWAGGVWGRAAAEALFLSMRWRDRIADWTRWLRAGHRAQRPGFEPAPARTGVTPAADAAAGDGGPADASPGMARALHASESAMVAPPEFAGADSASESDAGSNKPPARKTKSSAGSRLARRQAARTAKAKGRAPDPAPH